jgi:hypothetical protein
VGYRQKGEKRVQNGHFGPLFGPIFGPIFGPFLNPPMCQIAP